jgi:hypothetical protein
MDQVDLDAANRTRVAQLVRGYPSRMKGPRRPTTAFLGLSALATGTALSVWAATKSFGWFAYAPVPPDDEIHVPRFVTNQELLAWAVVADGLGGRRHPAAGRRPMSSVPPRRRRSSTPLSALVTSAL